MHNKQQICMSVSEEELVNVAMRASKPKRNNKNCVLNIQNQK